MTQEEKVKAYDEALLRAKNLHKDAIDMGENIRAKQCEIIFPELKESDDEKIRKAILEGLIDCRDAPDLGWTNFGGIEIDDCIAWLEKQDNFSKKDVDDAYLKGVTDTKNEIEKQYEANSQIRKDIASFILNYRGDIKDRAKWIDYLGIKVSFVKKKHRKEISEPAESEDKQIMKEIAEFIYNSVFKPKDIKKKEKWLTWLENQGEKPQGKSALEAINEEKVDNQNCVKPTDKVEPKFHEDDWAINRFGDIWCIDSFDSKNYQVSNGDKYGNFPIEKQNEMHQWTIADAKDGDVLADKYNNIGIFQECEGICWNSYIYLGCDGKLRGFSIGGSHEQTDTHPATKEQRDLLFTKIKEAGYEWEPKELRKEEVK